MNEEERLMLSAHMRHMGATQYEIDCSLDIWSLLDPKTHTVHTTEGEYKPLGLFRAIAAIINKNDQKKRK